jgi:Uncharacterised conserved protein (DUF2228)
MSRSKQKHQAKLTEIYGVYFPDSLFWLHDFIVEQRDCDDPIDLEDIGLYPCGVLSLLLNFDDLDRVEFTGDPLLHYRYYRDVPEFFTYLNGDCDGQHWGMLLDKPVDGFQGVAMYWSNDGAEMTVYDGIFDALLGECEDSIDCHEDYLRYEEEMTDYSKQQIELCNKLKNRVENFLAINQLPRYEFRLLGLETSCGLDVISNENSANHQRKAIEIFKSGKNLWYSDGENRSDEAFELIKRADELLTEYGLTTTCNSLFDALIADCDRSLERHTDFLPYLYDANDISSYQNQIDLSQKLKNRIENFRKVNRLSENESRSIGLENNIGMEIGSDDNCEEDFREAIEMLKLGRELWYWNGKDRSAEAYELMHKAYEMLDRPELIRILDVHYRDRDRNSVDVVRH